MKPGRNRGVQWLCAIASVAIICAPAVPGEARQTTTTNRELLSFDFGTASSTLDAGWTRVTSETLYSDAQGYGWLGRPSLSGQESDSDSASQRASVTGIAPATFR